MSLKPFRNLIFILALILLSGALGWQAGQRDLRLGWQDRKPQVTFINKEMPPSREIDFSLFWEVWDRLAKNYFDKTKLDPQKMFYGAISGLASSLDDPYTVFLPPEENKAFKEEMSGTKFEGIGAQLGMKDKRVIVIAPLRGTPAAEAGIKPGDYILKVDGKETINWTLPETVSKIRGPKGTKVVLSILHDGEEKPVEITVVRETIVVKSAEWERKNCQIALPAAGPNCQVAYLKLSRFGEDKKDWEKAADEISRQWQEGKIRGLVLDLRNNPGGYLSGAVYIASEFLKEGVVVQQESANGEKTTFSVNRRGKLTEIPLVVLINKGSASASEIVAGALKERRGATLVGEKSFGKGSIQEAQDLGGGAGLHITTAKWLLPSGKWINGEGLKPDIEVVLGEDPLKDPQLEKAIEALVK